MEINGRRAFKLPAPIGADGKPKPSNIVCFFEQPRRNEVQSSQQSRPIYDTALMVEIHGPGMKNQIHRAMVELRFANGSVRQCNSGFRDNDGAREVTWREYLGDVLIAYEKGTETPHGGTPLEAWNRIDVAQAASLREAHIFSVEQIAEVADTHLHALGMNGRTLRDQARNFLETAKGNSQADALIAENSDLKARMALLEKQFADMKAADPVNDGTEPRRRGAPPKQNVA